MGGGRGSREAATNSLPYLLLAMVIDTPTQWVCTRQMAAQLCIHRVTLQRLKSGGYFRHGHHYRKANPLSPRSNTVWHQQRVLMRMQAD